MTGGYVTLTDLWVDSGPMLRCCSARLSIEAELIDVTSGFGHTVRDPKWSHVDKAGHWHAAATRTVAGETAVWYPTLEEHRELNPEYDQALAHWDEYDEPQWLRWMKCAICAERVEPRTITSHERRYVAGPQHWRIEAQVADSAWYATPKQGASYTVRGMAPPATAHGRLSPVTPGRREWFGVARWHATEMRDAGGEATMVSGTFEGVSDLGERVG